MFECTNPSPYKQFSNIDPTRCGIDFRNDIKESQINNILRNEYTYNGAGVAVGDVNNDGLADVYFSGNSVSNKLYLNQGDWQFDDITASSGTGGRKDWTTGVVMVDVNGDGWLDIYVCYSGNTPGEGYNLPVIRNQPKRANQLFINNRCEPGEAPTFTDMAKEYGLDAIGTFSTQAYFFDYDLDGDLDMFLMNHANTFYAPFINTKKLRNLRHPYFGNRLYRNDQMHFVEVSQEAGIHGGGLNFGLSAAVSDINMDNWPDIYVTNDYDEQYFCYINNGDGTFREVTHTMLSHMSKSSMGSDIADINNDGYADILVLDMLPEDNHRQKLLRGQDNYDRYQLAVDSGFQHQYLRNTLQLNRGVGADGLPRYSEIGQFSGISNTDWSWSSLLVDLDNDGLRDMFITNGYLRDITNMDYMNHTADVYKMANSAKQDVNYLMLIEELPTTKLKNYIYKNLDGIKFKKDRVLLKVVDFDTSEPLIGANISFPNTDLEIAPTNIDGLTDIPRGISGNITISYIGYKSTNFEIDDSSVYNILVKMNVEEYSFGEYAFSVDRYDANRDISNGIIQIYKDINDSNKEISKNLASKYGFKFNYPDEVIMILDVEEYNNTVVKYLEKRNGTNWYERFKNELDARINENYKK